MKHSEDKTSQNDFSQCGVVDEVDTDSGTFDTHWSCMPQIDANLKIYGQYFFLISRNRVWTLGTKQ